MTQFIRAIRVAVGAGVLLTSAMSCERETRHLAGNYGTTSPGMVDLVDFQPGPTTAFDSVPGPFDTNAYGTAEGQTLFSEMNCSGCHSKGGGGMGPPLMDDEWIYGSAPNQIFSTIAEGRPNGMPAWRHRLTDKQIWELVAYVRSLSGLTPKGDRPNRDDHMMVAPAPSQTPNAKPKQVVRP
jgi:cytochrome c oxidase cbb3-type subunit 3